MDNLTQLKRKVDNLDKLIDEYSHLKTDTDNIGMQKSYDFFLKHITKKRSNIQEFINEIYSSIVKNAR